MSSSSACFPESFLDDASVFSDEAGAVDRGGGGRMSGISRDSGSAIARFVLVDAEDREAEEAARESLSTVMVVDDEEAMFLADVEVSVRAALPVSEFEDLLRRGGATCLGKFAPLASAKALYSDT